MAAGVCRAVKIPVRRQFYVVNETTPGCGRGSIPAVAARGVISDVSFSIVNASCNMHTELLRALLIEYLKAISVQPKHGVRQRLDFASCLNGVTGLAQQRCPEEIIKVSEGRYQLREEDGSRLKHVIWDLILERVLIPSTSSPTSMNDGWPSLSLTDHGHSVVTESKPIPYDPDGYLSRLDGATGGLHPSVKRYLEEAISTFRTGNYLASAVMLGATSEMLFLELCLAISGAIQDSTQRSKFVEKTASRKKMVDRLATVTDWLCQKRNQLPADWQRQEQVGLIEKVADMIRTVRNDAGHPQDPPAALCHEEMYALLVVFPHYCEKVYELQKWLLQHPGAIT